jgi:hypothetical protein
MIPIKNEAVRFILVVAFQVFTLWGVSNSGRPSGRLSASPAYLFGWPFAIGLRVGGIAGPISASSRYCSCASGSLRQAHKKTHAAREPNSITTTRPGGSREQWSAQGRSAMGSNGWRPHSAIGGYGAVLRYQGLARDEGPRFGWNYSRRQARTGPPASLKALKKPTVLAGGVRTAGRGGRTTAKGSLDGCNALAALAERRPGRLASCAVRGSSRLSESRQQRCP